MSDVLPTAPTGTEPSACPGCGEPAVSGAAFCHKCGHSLGTGAPPPAPPAIGPPAGPPALGASSGAGPQAGSTWPGWGQPGQPGQPARPPPGTGVSPGQGWGPPPGPAQPPPYASPYAAAYAPPAGGRSRVVAALLAFFLGGLGAHKFYLGRPWLGVLYLLFGWTLIPSLVGLVEFVLLLVMSDEKFTARYGHLTGSGAVVVLIVAGLAFAGVAVIGILAAIAIPNFIRYQLRAKASEVPVLLRALDQAEVGRRQAGQGYVVFADGLPQEQEPGRSKLTWSADDLELIADLAWSPGAATYARYAVDGQEDDDGNQAIALCGETDLDGDGHLAAWVIFRPALAADGSMVVPPPDAPCSATVALREGATLAFDPSVPPGQVRQVSPDGVF